MARNMYTIHSVTLIMLGDGPRCKVLGDNSFSAYWSDATTGTILVTITIIMKRKEKPTGRWQAKNKHLRKQVILSRIFINVWFRRLLLSINPKKKKKKKKKKGIRNRFFYLSSNSFASFLSQTSNLVHRSLHLSTWSPRFTSHDLYLRCRSLASRAKRSFYFGPPKINGSNSKLSLLWLHNLEKKRKKKKKKKKKGKERWRYKHHCFILSSSLLSFNGLFAPYNNTWKNVFIIF